MSLLIDALQEVEQTEQKDEEKLDSDNSSNEWADEFLPEFAQALTQDSTRETKSDSEKNYYEQSVEEFLGNTKTNIDISQNVENSSLLEKESETETFSENQEFLLSESLAIESPELEQNLEKSIETENHDESDLTASTEKTVADIFDTLTEMNEEEIIALTESTETESEEMVNLAEKQAVAVEVENEHTELSEPEIPSSPVDKSNFLKDNQYVLSASTLMGANHANRKKWVYGLLFVMFAGMGWLGFSYYETLIALESGSSLSLPKSGNLRLKSISQQPAIDEKNQQNEPIIESAENLDSENFQENEEAIIDNIVEEEVEEFQSEQISSVVLPAIDFFTSMTETAFSPVNPVNENALQKVAQTEEEAPAREESEKIEENEDIKIIRKNNPRYLNVNLSKAYAAFQRGDDASAKTAYTDVLRQDVKNRDALLGLAAIALRGNDFQQAQQFYQKVLLYYPQDKVAQVGLVAAQGNRGDQKTESHLKFLLSQSPNSAYIHFSLANFYAQQGRWTEAQQAYFKAFEYDSQRADYAYNLAVSLEHIQQQKTALHYYQLALQLAQFQSINFDMKMAEQRIIILKTQLNQ